MSLPLWIISILMLPALARASLEVIEPYLGKWPARAIVAVVFILVLRPTVSALLFLIQVIALV
jgi:hypothetical protein